MEEDPTYYFTYEDIDENGAEETERINFIDCASAAADALNDLLATYLPYGVDVTSSSVQWTFRLNGLTMEVVNQESEGVGVFALSDVMPRRRLDPLREELRGIVKIALGEAIWNTLSFGCMLLQLAEEAAWHLQEFQKFQPPSKKKKQPGWDATSVNDWAAILDNQHGVDLLTVNDTAKFLLGQSIANICKDIDQDYVRVLHVEPVFRSDLVTRFLQRRKQMKEELTQMSLGQLRDCVTRSQLRSREVHDSAEGIAEYLCTPHVTFHGAPRSVVSSIVRYGFVKPGEQIGKTNDHVDIRCGASYGVGVYSSPSLDFASSYSMYSRGSGDVFGFRNPGDIPGLRMVVCATLMGRSLQVTRDEARRTRGLLRENAHSHVSPEKLEYIVFDTAQIIPCYVLHLDYGAQLAREHFDSICKDPTLLSQGKLKSRIDTGSFQQDDEGPGARQAKKDALKAAAAKWFPYGYGPATGTRFVIEEIGEVSDDEEEYGEFQERRGEQEEAFSYQRSGDEKSSWFDEYQTVRHTKGEVRTGPREDDW